MRIHILLLLVLVVLFSCCKKENDSIPLPEHPRPNFERSLWQNLNGTWKFRPDSANVGLKENWQTAPENFTDEILVPFSWASPASGARLPKVNYAWYSRTFKPEKPEDWQGKQVYLNFCASDFNTSVWINGQKVGDHNGGYTPFDFNITKYFQEGENELVVRVEDEELDNRPSGKQYYGNAKGIWQTVYLEARPENHITGIFFTPDIDKEEVGVKLVLNHELQENAEFLLAGSGLNFRAALQAGTRSQEFTIPIKNMRLWDLDNPYLYNVKVWLNGNHWSDDIATYFGMRKISAVNVPGKEFQYVALNNKPLYLRLTLDQSYHPDGFYTFPSDAFMKEEIQRAKDLGLNGIRIHIKAEMPRKLYWADKLGLLVQEDIPNFWGEPDSTAKANWEQVATAEMARDYNSPSIFSWVLFNETWGLFSKNEEGQRVYSPETQDWVRSWYHKAKDFDQTRLVEDNSPCNWDHVITDINTWHRYSPARHWAGFLDMVCENTYPGSGFNFIGNNVQGNQPMFNSECGAVWGYNGSTGDIDITWEYHIMMNEFRKRPKIAGFLFTEFHDVINEWNGYYRFDRSKKEFGLDELCPGMTMRDFHADLYVVAGKDFFQTYKGGSSVEIPIGISAVSTEIPQNLKIRYTVYGWDALGDKQELSSGEQEAKARAFEFVEQNPITINLPDMALTGILATELVDGNGMVLQRNFVPFKVEGSRPDDILVLTKSPTEFSDASWSIKYLARQNDRKVWGMGSGFFEYTFDLPEGLSTENVESIEFRAELASRYPQEKYLEDGEAERIGMEIVSEKGKIPGYGQNSYPQTDQKLHGSLVKITANENKIGEVELSDDPADHRGILSWMNQEPGSEWGSDDHSKPWLLDEAGSYGYLVVEKFDEALKNAVLEAGQLVLQMHVDEQTKNRGGLSVYGADSGRYPMDVSIVIKKK
ncbi:glycoside hydrolase family 2 protein [Maribellus sediminis]|uniref:glycoside hydrolase family 2 protein n=1 Tax=Maribellus sediminis TaxID=2696285 RepID=UPI0014322D34|nr:sugar-binding domain-containing protein [Maribellus sediminis]